MADFALADNYLDSPASGEVVAELPLATVQERGWSILIPFTIPLISAGISWISGGVPILTDIAMILLTALCVIFVAIELREFNRRAGIGGLLLFGGVVIWFCHDYMSHWLRTDFQDPAVYFSAGVIAKCAFMHCLFIFFAVVGLRMRGGAWMEKAITFAPEPGGKNVYIAAMLLLCLGGMTSFFFFTRENGFISMAKAALPYILGDPEWTVGRTGNVNYNWGGYVAQIMQLGEFSALLGCFYAIVLSEAVATKILCWTIWLFWAMVAYGTGRRGNIVAMTLPPMAFWFMKYQMLAAEKGRRYSMRAYVFGGAVLVGTLVVTQMQGTFRDVGLESATFSKLDVTKSQGNTMFSEGLTGYATIPEMKGFFYDSFPGEAIIRPIPQTLYWFIVDPIPRALWTDKPIDPVWAWYNGAYVGSSTSSIEGTTISQGLVGYWYFRYGISGIIQGGILFGWACAICERALRQRASQPIKILMTLAFATWLFRIYRDVNFHFLYSVLIGAIGLALLTPVLKIFSGGSQSARSSG